MLKIEISIDLFLLHARDHLLIVQQFMALRLLLGTCTIHIVNLHGDEKFPRKLNKRKKKSSCNKPERGVGTIMHTRNMKHETCIKL